MTDRPDLTEALEALIVDHFGGSGKSGHLTCWVLVAERMEYDSELQPVDAPITVSASSPSIPTQLGLLRAGQAIVEAGLTGGEG